MFAYAGSEPDHFHVEFMDQIMHAGKEDASNTLQALVLATIKFKQAHPEKTWAFLKTDGASCYSKSIFTRGLSLVSELTKVQIREHHLGEAGKNKTELDGHFGITGTRVRRKVINAGGGFDVKSAHSLYEVLSAIKAIGGHAHLFEPSSDKWCFDGAAPMRNLNRIAHRRYTYDAHGKFEHLYLHQQSGKGSGEHMSRTQVLGDAFILAAIPSGRIIHHTAADNNHKHRTLVTGAAKRKIKATREEKRVTAQDNKRQRKLIKALDPMDIIHTKHMDTKASGRRSGTFACRCDERGNSKCTATFNKRLWFEKHLTAGKHTCGTIGASTRRSLVSVTDDRGSLNDRFIRQIQLSDQRRVHQSKAEGNGTTESSTSSGVTYLIDGTVYRHAERECGWACTRRLPTEQKTKAQLRFIFECYDVGVRDIARKMSPCEAHELMKIVGTKEAQNRQPNIEYFKANDEDSPIFSRVDILDEHSIKPYFGMNRLHLLKLSVNVVQREQRGVSKTITALQDMTAKWHTDKEITQANLKVLLSHLNETHEPIKKTNKGELVVQLEGALRSRSMFTKEALEMEIVRLQLLLPPPTPLPSENPTTSTHTIPPVEQQHASASSVLNVVNTTTAMLDDVREDLFAEQTTINEDEEEEGMDCAEGSGVSGLSMRYT